MQSSWETLAAAFESPQGNTFYALMALLLLSAASLWLQNRAKPGTPGLISRLLLVLMGLRLLEALVFAAGWSGNSLALQLAPALERSLHLLSLGLLAWLWTPPSLGEKLAKLVYGLAILASLVLGSALIYFQVTSPVTSFNYSDADYGWGAACLVVLLFAIVRVLKTQQTVGLVTFGILLLGQTAHLLLAEPFGSMPLATQAAMLIVLPLLFLVPVKRRGEVRILDQAAPAKTDEVEVQATETKGELEPAGLESVLPEEDFEFFDFDQQPASAVPLADSTEELARVIAEDLGADLCVFARAEQAGGELKLEAGYNVARSATIEPTGIPLAEVPRLRSAISSQQPLLLSAEQRLPELWSLSKALRLSFQAHLLALPLQISGEAPWAMLLLSLERSWQSEDQLKLASLSVELSSQLAAVISAEKKEAPAAITEPPTAEAALPVPAAPEVSASQTEVQRLEAENERYRKDVKDLLVHIDELETLPRAAIVMQSSELVDSLQAENERLKAGLAGLEASGPAVIHETDSLEASQAREELRLAMEEVARLHEQLAAQLAAQAKPALPTEGALAPSPSITEHQVEVIASIAQELRQPLSSIVGYTDLLLGESVGILGALQRKFLDRVRNSTERMNTLIDNLIRIAQLDQAAADRKPVDLSAVIDDAIALLRGQLQEKRIALRVDLPETLPQLNTDRDALQQILFHLLQNADAATPAEGEITLRANVDQQKDLGDFVLIQVSDSGGGIPEEDLPRVFSRVYRSSNPVIAGVGETGVGLSIAETLTQALGGRIWVESEPGVGAKFSILLPLNPG